MRPARHRRPVRGPVPRRLQIAQQRLLGHAHADPLQALVVPRPLHGEQPQQAAAERGTGRAGHRSHASTVPPAIPATNQPRFAPRPTTRRVPAVATLGWFVAGIAGGTVLATNQPRFAPRPTTRRVPAVEPGLV